MATSSVLFAVGVAGIYYVATLEHAHRKGIGTAMTLEPLREALVRGYRTAVLQASAMGLNVYARLGFQQVCECSAYDWHPETDL